MIPIKLTENHYINPDAIAHLCCNPKTAGDAPALFIVFTGEEQTPLELHGAEAQEAIAKRRDEEGKGAAGHKARSPEESATFMAKIECQRL